MSNYCPDGMCVPSRRNITSGEYDPNMVQGTLEFGKTNDGRDIARWLHAEPGNPIGVLVGSVVSIGAIGWGAIEWFKNGNLMTAGISALIAFLAFLYVKENIASVTTVYKTVQEISVYIPDNNIDERHYGEFYSEQNNNSYNNNQSSQSTHYSGIDYDAQEYGMSNGDFPNQTENSIWGDAIEQAYANIYGSNTEDVNE